MNLFHFWAGISPWWQYGIAILLLLISTVLYFCGTFWPWGWAVGGVMLIFAGPSDSERKGYRF